MTTAAIEGHDLVAFGCNRPVVAPGMVDAPSFLDSMPIMAPATVLAASAGRRPRETHHLGLPSARHASEADHRPQVGGQLEDESGEVTRLNQALGIPAVLQLARGGWLARSVWRNM